MSGFPADGRAGGGSRLDGDSWPVTTAGAIAMGNLDARIEGLTSQASRGSLTGAGWAELVELTALRGHVLGRIDESERAATLAEAFVDLAPRDPLSHLARARAAAFFHRFPAALAELDAAAALGLDGRSLDAERAAVHQAVGRYDEALALHRQALARRPDFSALGALAGWHAERGETVAAETWLLAARRAHRGVSPFPLAVLECRCGQMWLAQGDLRRARSRLESAARRLPAYVPAQRHLADVDAAEGRAGAAIGRLRRAAAGGDPDCAARLARVLGEAGASAEARFWRAHAAERYEDLLARHPEAYADHAAEFWLTVGGDPRRALRLALRNLEFRPTPRAHMLVDHAMCQCRTGLTAPALGTTSADA
ncbi:tetratricopeptide repeat protein [Kitasatospora sp. NPDC056531]|uniref:tetratricopeptide repeat protein n=1 Tax=Kitasatospora sp. NPDC056531 TaxID=3345856 RepID=UPI003674ADA1